MGGFDQWGNITTGTELIRRKVGGEAYALTCPLITKADGTKFGKTEQGNVWLDPKLTSPYKFYQFWLNTSDEDAARYIKIFTLLNRQEIDGLIEEHSKEPHLRKLQKELAKQLTIMVHSQQDYEVAVEASAILFGNATAESLRKIDEDTFLSVFEGVPSFDVPASALAEGVSFSALCAEMAPVFPSKGELRRLVKGGGISMNREKVEDSEMVVTSQMLINNKFLVVQKGKKSYNLIRIV